MRLKIGNVFGVCPLFPHHCANLLKLLTQGQIFIACKIPASFGGTVGAAPHPFCAVDIRAGKSCVQRNFCNLTAEFLLEKIMKGMIPFIGIGIQKRIFHYLFSKAAASSSAKMVTSGCRRRILAGTFGVIGP